MKKVFLIIILLCVVFILPSCKEDYRGDFIVVEENGQIVKGKDAMDAFYEQTKNGEKLRLDYYLKFESDGEIFEESFYIKYDGTYYITNYQMFENSFNETRYKYLIYSKEEGKPDSNIAFTEYYCLANDPSHTYQVVIRSWLSAIFQDHIHDAVPFYVYREYKDGFKVGSYKAKLDGDYNITINFMNSIKYNFDLGVTSSFISDKYEINNGYVYLMFDTVTDDGVLFTDKLAFKIEQDKLIYSSAKSQTIDPMFKDGQVFYYVSKFDSIAKHKVTVIDNHGILLEPLEKEYNSSDIVQVKLQFFSGIKAGIMVNDKLIEVSSDAVVWEYEIYEFIMPDEDVIIYTTINGKTEKPE